MKNLIYLVLICFSTHLSAQSIKDRIKSNDPSTYRDLSAVHDGAGSMGFTQLIGRNDLASNFLYLHAGQIQGKSGIGHHFHHSIEEMYVILDGEAEFTINGQTSLIKAPAIVPCKMGQSHAIYNPTDENLTWLNFAVSRTKGQTDAFDLGDARVGVLKVPVPTFVSGRLDHDKFKINDKGESTLNRRIFGPEIFTTDWNHVDHVMIPVGHNTINRKMDGIEEVYYVIKGNGTISIGNDSGKFKSNDVFYGSLGETLVFSNEGADNLEFLVIGIAPAKHKGLAAKKPLSEPKAMVLQMDFVVESQNAKAFEEMYYSVYVPAMTVQQGYLNSKLLRLFPDNLANEIEAESTDYNYQIMISFDTEENRRKWVGSKQHDIAWPAASDLSKAFKWKGYHVMGDDDQK